MSPRNRNPSGSTTKPQWPAVCPGRGETGPERRPGAAGHRTPPEAERGAVVALVPPPVTAHVERLAQLSAELPRLGIGQAESRAGDPRAPEGGPPPGRP